MVLASGQDIMTFARVFTGLDRQVPRRNLEEVLSSNGNGRTVWTLDIWSGGWMGVEAMESLGSKAGC